MEENEVIIISSPPNTDYGQQWPDILNLIIYTLLHVSDTSFNANKIYADLINANPRKNALCGSLK